MRDNPGINKGTVSRDVEVGRNEKPLEKLARCDLSILVDDRRSKHNIHTVITHTKAPRAKSTCT